MSQVCSKTSSKTMSLFCMIVWTPPLQKNFATAVHSRKIEIFVFFWLRPSQRDWLACSFLVPRRYNGWLFELPSANEWGQEEGLDWTVSPNEDAAYISKCSDDARQIFAFEYLPEGEVLIKLSRRHNRCLERSKNSIYLNWCDATSPLQRWYAPNGGFYGYKFEFSQHGYEQKVCHTSSPSQRRRGRRTVLVQPYAWLSNIVLE